jgi:hypothetical protein
MKNQLRINGIERILIRKIRAYSIITALLTLILFLLSINMISAQGVQSSLSIQKTVLGLQKGFELGYVNRQGWGLITFHQSALNTQNEKLGSSYNFNGLMFQAPIKQCADISINGQLKLGMVNKNFFIIIPQLEFQLKVFNKLSLGFNSSYRMNQAAIGTRLIIDL